MDGFPVAFHLEVISNGNKDQVLALEECKINPGVEAKLFDKPVFPDAGPDAGRDPGAGGAAQEEVAAAYIGGQVFGARTPSKRLCIHWMALDALTRAAFMWATPGNVS